MRFILKPGFIALFALSILFTAAPMQRAQACCSCAAVVAATSTAQWAITTPLINSFVTSELTGQKLWLTSVLWEDNILPALMMMAEQLTAVAMQQTMIFGTFMDAKHQMETQQVLQALQAQAHKDYQPSAGLCEFGSSIKSLAASERRGEFNAVALSQRSQDRQLGAANTAAAAGIITDKPARIAQYKTTFCNPADSDFGLNELCDRGDNIDDAALQRTNLDIDFVRAVDSPWTLDVDFTNADVTDDEENILALASNLYGHDVFFRPTTGLNVTGSELTGVQESYMDLRSIVAKRSVAENSFNAITAMKTAGTPGSKQYLTAILKELGLSEANGEIDRILGNNPSYYAQMEVLTKKIYQNPDFYTNLYDKPANVERKGVALQAIGLMQKFDLFKSYLRQEAAMSVLLELSVAELQDKVESELNQK